MPGINLAMDAFQRADDEVDFRVGRELTHRRDGGRAHQQVADALEPQQQDAPRPVAAARPGVAAAARRQAGHRRRHRQPGVGQADQHAFARVVDLQVAEHRIRLPLYRTSTRSTMTPSCRSSGVPSTSRGFQTVTASLRRAGVSRAAASAAIAGGIGTA